VTSVLIAETVDSVRVITLNRPESRNALGAGLIEAMYDALVEADDDPSVHAVVLTGADPAFCAGVDLKEAGRDGQAYFDRYQDKNCIGRVAQMAKPVVGAINGPTFTGGLEAALGCDFLIASERAVFADTHVRVGVLPGGGMTARLPLVVGVNRARRMSMTGEVVDAQEALRIGLVTEVVAHDRLLPRSIEVAQKVAGVDPAMMAGLKRMYQLGASTYVDPALAVEKQVADENPADLAGIEGRRQSVMANNKSQIR
jgi:enoyl-CoA hydratase